VQQNPLSFGLWRRAQLHGGSTWPRVPLHCRTWPGPSQPLQGRSGFGGVLPKYRWIRTLGLETLSGTI